jgi:hypothetical protein
MIVRTLSAFRTGPAWAMRREEEAEAGVVEDLARFERRQVEACTERLKHIGRAAFGRE